MPDFPVQIGTKSWVRVRVFRDFAQEIAPVALSRADIAARSHDYLCAFATVDVIEFSREKHAQRRAGQPAIPTRHRSSLADFHASLLTHVPIHVLAVNTSANTLA